MKCSTEDLLRAVFYCQCEFSTAKSWTENMLAEGLACGSAPDRRDVADLTPMAERVQRWLGGFIGGSGWTALRKAYDRACLDICTPTLVEWT